MTFLPRDICSKWQAGLQTCVWTSGCANGKEAGPTLKSKGRHPFQAPYKLEGGGPGGGGIQQIANPFCSLLLGNILGPFLGHVKVTEGSDNIPKRAESNNPRSSSREVRIRVPFFSVVYFSWGSLPQKG